MRYINSLLLYFIYFYLLYLLLSLKVGTDFTILQRVDGWMDQGNAVRVCSHIQVCVSQLV